MSRVQVVDTWRGIAIICMVFYHIAVPLDFLGVLHQNTLDGPWLMFARFIQYSFIGLVGVSLALSSQRTEGFYRRQLRRSGILALCALAVSLGTWIVLPDMYVRFGILHFITVASLIALPFAGEPKKALGMAVFTGILGVLLQYFSTDSEWLVLLGIPLRHSWFTIDFFPIFRWIWVVFAGIAIGHRLIHSWLYSAKSELDVVDFFAAAGKKSLIIYMIHAPIILLFLRITGIVDSFRFS